MTSPIITSEQRNEAIKLYPKLSSLIESGHFEYSATKLRSDFESYKFYSWFASHVKTTITILIVIVLVGVGDIMFPPYRETYAERSSFLAWIPLLVWMLIIKAHQIGADRYQVHVLKYRNKGFDKKSTQSPDLSTQLTDLSNLYSSGALSESEFILAKTALLKK